LNGTSACKVKQDKNNRAEQSEEKGKGPTLTDKMYRRKKKKKTQVTISGLNV